MPSIPNLPADAPNLAEGRYVLVSRIGEGGLAAVYRAYDKKLRVWRAVKLLMPEFSRRKSMCERLESEALTMAQLEHPNLVRVYDVGYVGTIPYLVMELVTGGTLHHWIDKHGIMPPALAAESTLQVLRGLSAVHEMGVIHRDVKPRNVLIAPNAVCKLTDFGIAHSGESKSGGPKMIGTMGYSAPEQLVDPSSVDARADIYSVGATLWHLCTARDVPEDLYRAERDPKMLSRIHDALHPVILGCIARDRNARFESAEQVATNLEEVIHDLPSPPLSTPELPMDVSNFEETLTGASFPELVQIMDAQRKRTDIRRSPAVPDRRPDSPPPFSHTPTSEEPTPVEPSRASGDPRTKPLPYVMASVDPEARRRALLGGLLQGALPPEDDMPEWIDTKTPIGESRSVGYSKEISRGDFDEELTPLPAPPPTPPPVVRTVQPAPQKPRPKNTPPPAPSRATPVPATPAPSPSRRTASSEGARPKPAPPAPVEHEPESDDRSWLWLVAMPLFVAIGLGTAFAIAATIFIGNGMLSLTEAELDANKTLTHLYRVLGDEREVVDELASLGSDRSSLESLYMDYLQEKDPNKRLEAARTLVAQIDKESFRIDENLGQTQVGHRVRQMRNAMRDYESALEEWQERADSRAGSIVVAMGLGEPPP